MSDNSVEIQHDGESIVAREGQSVLAALWASGVRTLHTTARYQDARSAYCGIGVCFDCIATVNGEPNVRTCMVPVQSGLVVETQRDPGILE